MPGDTTRGNKRESFGEGGTGENGSGGTCGCTGTPLRPKGVVLPEAPPKRAGEEERGFGDTRGKLCACGVHDTQGEGDGMPAIAIVCIARDDGVEGH